MARDGHQISQDPGKECPVKSLEPNLWTVVSRKADPADSREMPLARKRKQPEKETLRKDKYNLKLFFLLPFVNIGNCIYIYIYSEKERKKLKRFVLSIVNERMDLDTFSSKRKKSIKKKKTRKKEETKKRKKKKERHLCLTLPTWLNKADSLKERKKERHLCLKLSAGLI